MLEFFIYPNSHILTMFFSDLQTLWTSSEAETSVEAAPEKKDEAPAAEEKQAE